MPVTPLQDDLVHRVNVGDTLTRTADRMPAKVALVDGERRITYRQLDVWTNRLAHALVDRGYAPGDSLALASGNSAEFLAVYYACAKAGVVCVPLNLGWRPDEAAFVLGHAGVRGVVVETQLVDWVGQALEGQDGIADVVVAPGTDGPVPDTLAGRATTTIEAFATHDSSSVDVLVGDRAPMTYLYTSGTTSAPKGVVGNHLAVVVESLTMALEARWTDKDRFVADVPHRPAQLLLHPGRGPRRHAARAPRVRRRPAAGCHRGRADHPGVRVADDVPRAHGAGRHR